jgi:heme A synthase
LEGNSSTGFKYLSKRLTLKLGSSAFYYLKFLVSYALYVLVTSSYSFKMDLVKSASNLLTVSLNFLGLQFLLSYLTLKLAVPALVIETS